ncbi:cell division protein [Bacteroidia bacterium]|nr:cell division protein [Bacteroidia bacterium]
MLRLVSHIEYLLRIHDCVIVPQLGGFVLQVVPASYVEEEHLFRPMHKEVVFNSKLKHNDGLLSERYMESYGVTFQRAYRMLEEDVASIQSSLQKSVNVSLGAVGSLSVGNEGQIIFQAGDAHAFSVDSYGLPAFQMKTWNTLQLEHVSPLTVYERKNTFYIPINRRILRGVASVAAAIALFLTISTPVKEVNRSAYTASFIPTEIVTKVVNTQPTEKAPEIEVVTTPSKPANIPVVNKNVKKNVGKTAVVKEPSEVYYVIIGSMSTDQQANDFMAYNIDFKTMKNANKLFGSNHVRIYADKFTDKSTADAYLAKVRQNPQFFDAWLYTMTKK